MKVEVYGWRRYGSCFMLGENVGNSTPEGPRYTNQSKGLPSRSECRSIDQPFQNKEQVKNLVKTASLIIYLEIFAQ